MGAELRQSLSESDKALGQRLDKTSADFHAELLKIYWRAVQGATGLIGTFVLGKGMAWW